MGSGWGGLDSGRGAAESDVGALGSAEDALLSGGDALASGGRGLDSNVPMVSAHTVCGWAIDDKYFICYVLIWEG